MSFQNKDRQQSNQIVDIYIPLDGRASANATVWPVAQQQLKHILSIIERSGFVPNLLNAEEPISSVAQGLEVVKKAKGSRFINFLPGWAYPDFSVSPMWQLDAKIPKLMLGSAIKDFPGAVALFAAASGTAQMGIETSRLFVEDFSRTSDYEQELLTFLHTGKIVPKSTNVLSQQKVSVETNERHQKAAMQALAEMRGQVYGAIGPRSMQMWNKISEADFLKYFGIAREGFDGLRLAKMAEKIDDSRAQKAVDFLLEKGMDLKLGSDPKTHLTREMVVFQMKVYFALLDLKQQFGLDFLGVQDQLDWIDHYPATDLTLGLLNNRLRPESDGQTVVVSTEVDDGAAVTMQLLKILSGGEPVGFNDLRYWDSKQNLYWFVNSGALAPYFARGSHDSLAGSWSERQTPMYFAKGGGTSSVVVRKPGTVTWARFSYRNHKLYLCAGRGVTDVPTHEQWVERSNQCSPDWPHWYLKLCGPVEDYINSNHPITVCGDYLSELKAVAQLMDIPFECYDVCTPENLGR